ncbi:MAG: CRISPR-associated protein Cas4 [Dehalococcoidia bacterium]|nr:CRISPR-associated protein Cas4 [Dehalococcoidia bacterium]
MQEDQTEVTVSAIEHYSYCPRQCALIHVEQVWDENRGGIAHERVDVEDSELRRGVRIERAVPIWSERLGLRGKADLIEMRPEGPYPVEYKVGKPRGRHAEMQLCAQALCLEEMLGVAVPSGALYFHGLRRRQEILLDERLRAETERAILAIRGILDRQELPDAPNDSRCPHCSLINSCLPNVVAESARLRGHQGALFQPFEVGAGDAFDVDE